MSKAKLFDGPRFMNDVTNELLKTPIAKETLGDAATHATNFDVRKVASTLDQGLKKQMDVEFQRLYQTLPSTLLKEALIKFVIFTNLLVKNGLQSYGITVDDPNFQERLPESAMNMGNIIIILDQALENPEVKQAFDRFNSTLAELLQQFLQTAAFVLEEFKPALMQQGNEIVQYAGEIGQASGDAFVKGGMSALGTIPGVGQVVNVARLNSAIAPLQAKGLRAVNIASSMLDKITQKLNKVEPKVVAIADPIVDAQQQGKVLIDNLSKTTNQINTVNV
tara:strand:- start:5870 stop:6706 length:837 start_codon:yes stop_codon:yes gene_type:complete